MGIIRDMQRAHATQVAAQQRAGTAAAQQRDLIRRNADLAIAAAQQAASDAARRQEGQRLYAQARTADAAKANAGLRARIAGLDALLLSTLDVDDHIDLGRFKKIHDVPPFEPGGLSRAAPEPEWADYAPPAPRRLGKNLGGEKLHQQQTLAARRAYQHDRERWVAMETSRLRQLGERELAYAAKKQRYEERITAYNAEVDRFAAAVAGRDPKSVVEYFAMVLGNSVYPDDFPQHFRLAYLPQPRQLLIEYHLPPVEVVPAVKEYRYDRVRDDLSAVPRDELEIRRRYVGIVAQVTLRTIHEIVEADRGALVEKIAFNGIVDTVDRRTGQFVRPCLVSVRTDRETFAAIKLRRVEPVACLDHLRGTLSAEPDRLTGVTPVVDFDREADRDYTEEFNVLAEIDERPNLSDMPDDEFQSLLTDLFGNLGLEMTGSSPCAAGLRLLATDPRPIFGGRVVIDAVRHGRADAAAATATAEAVTAAGATKGILVTTGGIDAAVHERIAGQPIELIDGPALLGLLAEHSRVQARIEH